MKEPAGPEVVIPTHNAAPLLAQSLASLRRQTTPHRVIVVDNHSTDGTAALLRDRFPEVELVALPSNVGFARAVNRGAAAGSSPIVVFVNNDIVCEPTFLEQLVRALEPERGIVMAAGVLLSAAQPGIIDSAGIEFDRTLLPYDYLHGEPVEVLERVAANPFGPSGGAAAFDRRAFEAVGGFDERFFAYLEDVDLALRLIATGGSCRLARQARAVHRHSATLGSGSRRKNELMGWGRGYMIGKYRLYRQPWPFSRAVVAELAISAGQVLIDRTAVGFPARASGFRAGLRTAAHEVPELPGRAYEISLAQSLRRRLRRRLRRNASGRGQAPAGLRRSGSSRPRASPRCLRRRRC